MHDFDLVMLLLGNKSLRYVLLHAQLNEEYEITVMSARKPPPRKEQRHSSEQALNTSWRKTTLAFSENLNNNAGILHLHKVVDRPEAWKSGRSLVWSRTSACHADDPGSNLGDRTTTAPKSRFKTLISS
jgi:hypothetical protein